MGLEGVPPQEIVLEGVGGASFRVVLCRRNALLGWCPSVLMERWLLFGVALGAIGRCGVPRASGPASRERAVVSEECLLSLQGDIIRQAFKACDVPCIRWEVGACDVPVETRFPCSALGAGSGFIDVEGVGTFEASGLWSSLFLC